MKKIIIVILIISLQPLVCSANPLIILSGTGAAPPAADTPIFSDVLGFEAAFPGNWDSTSGSPTLQSSVVAKGSQAISTDAAEYAIKAMPSAKTEVWSDFWIRYATYAGGTHQIWKMHATGGASWVYMSSTTGQLRVTDGTHNYDTGISPSIGVWYHIFLHIELGVDGSEVIQVAINSVDQWDAWDYETSAATINPADMLTLNFGRVTTNNSNVIYFDTCDVYDTAAMPSTW